MLIYLATNRFNGKVYVGQTCQPLRERKGDHRRKAQVHRSRSHFHAAIRKYGFEAFEWRVLERVLLREILNERERCWIKHYRSTNPARGYNNTHGGDSFEFTPEARQKIGDAGRGIKRSESFKAHLREIERGAGNPFYGRHHSEEAKAKNRAAHIGRRLTPEHIAKCLKRGEDNGRAGVTTETVRAIKRDLAAGVSGTETARRHGASYSTVKNIMAGKSWRHVIAS